MASKREPKQSLKEEAPAQEKAALDKSAAEMEFDEFVREFRRMVQGYLWSRADKITVADLVRLRELEEASEQKNERKRPKELRVVWIDKKNESAT
ncbi:MAG: hypothetical protein WB676_05025 [Bryobacteraceae bacterium]